MVSFVHTVALALAVARGAVAYPWPNQCGALNNACCDIPDNDPNGGTCRDDTLLSCWEGFCKPCGTDGMPVCAGPTPCTGKNIIQVGTFCTFDNSNAPAAPEPTPKPAPKPSKPPSRRPGKVKGPRSGRRTRMRNPKAPRGTVKAPKPTPPPAPKAAKVDDKPAALRCGDLKWECCDIPDNDPNAGTCRDDTLMTCWEGVCKRCGTDGMPICAGSKPCTGKLVAYKGFCTFDNGHVTPWDPKAQV